MNNHLPIPILDAEDAEDMVHRIANTQNVNDLIRLFNENIYYRYDYLNDSRVLQALIDKNAQFDNKQILSLILTGADELTMPMLISIAAQVDNVTDLTRILSYPKHNTSDALAWLEFELRDSHQNAREFSYIPDAVRIAVINNQHADSNILEAAAWTANEPQTLKQIAQLNSAAVNRQVFRAILNCHQPVVANVEFLDWIVDHCQAEFVGELVTRNSNKALLPATFAKLANLYINNLDICCALAGNMHVGHNILSHIAQHGPANHRIFEIIFMRGCDEQTWRIMAQRMVLPDADEELTFGFFMKNSVFYSYGYYPEPLERMCLMIAPLVECCDSEDKVKKVFTEQPMHYILEQKGYWQREPGSIEKIAILLKLSVNKHINKLMQADIVQYFTDKETATAMFTEHPLTYIANFQCGVTNEEKAAFVDMMMQNPFLKPLIVKECANRQTVANLPPQVQDVVQMEALLAQNPVNAMCRTYRARQALIKQKNNTVNNAANKTSNVCEFK